MTTGTDAKTRRRRRPLVHVLGELHRLRFLVRALLFQQISSRYRGSVLGFFWTFLNPLLLMAVYSLVFRFYIRIDVPAYPVFLLSGLLPWIWFSAAVTEGTNSIVSGGSLVTKSLFSAEILPTVPVLAGCVNFLLSLPVLIAMGWLYGITPNPLLWICLPVVVFLQIVFTAGLSLALAAWNVPYRDVQHVVANLLLLWFFVCPILYPVSMIPEGFRFITMMNPMALVASSYQAIFFDGTWPDPSELALLAAYAYVTLYFGARVFDSWRDSFSELV